jgi:hypothetical protein
MVDISEKLSEIKKLVDNGSYFTINKARQYGKTTTLYALEKVLENEYVVALLSFEGVGEDSYDSESNFCKMFTTLIKEEISDDIEFEPIDKNPINFIELSKYISILCKNQKFVLLIDEVDNASDYKIFRDFLGMLRNKYIKMQNEKDFSFSSVILAGVHDIKNLKLRMIQKGNYVANENEGNFNSPWNIAVDFEVDMSFNPKDISTMLVEYQNEQKIEFNISEISDEIYSYTSGYPYLVSRICKHIDEKLNKDWTVAGIEKAVKLLITEKNTLFDDLFKNLENDKSLFDLIYAILILGEERKYSIDVSTTNFGLTYGIIRNENNKIKISNKIFEIRICEFFISKDESVTKKSNVLKYDIVKNNRFDMKLCLEKFAEYYKEIYAENDLNFLEKHGRLLFLSYLRPLINGEGFFHIESQFTDLRRMDLVIDFNNQQFVIELKIWDGDTKHKEAYKQLSNYLEKKNLKTGYLLTFNFNKNKEKVKKISTEKYGDYEIFDVIV